MRKLKEPTTMHPLETLIMRTLWLALASMLLLAMVLPGQPAKADAGCVPTSGGMDYHSYLCVDPSDPKCPVYTLHHTDWGVQRKCYPEVPG